MKYYIEFKKKIIQILFITNKNKMYYFMVVGNIQVINT